MQGLLWGRVDLDPRERCSVVLIVLHVRWNSRNEISNRFHADAFLSVPESGEVYNHQTKLILLGTWNFAQRGILHVGKFVGLIALAAWN